MKLLRWTSRIIVGIVFIFSGFVKAVDPSGSEYKFQDYFTAFHLDFLKDLALPLAIILCAAEFISGFSVLTGFRIKYGIWVVMILMVIFTPLTFILALTNPVSDCGCFGDAIHLTNWQTFFKNVVLILFTIILFISRNSFKPVGEPVREWGVISLMSVLFVLFSFYNLRYLPVMDFLPYKQGVYIPDKMIIPEGKPVDEYYTTFIYEKDGLKKEFTLENYPYDDSTWVFVDQISVLVKKGYEPPIHDFAITCHNEDITDRILGDEGYTMLMICHKIEDASEKKLAEGFRLGNYLEENGINFYVVTASAIGLTDITDHDPDICSGDEIALKTIVRSNPGYMLLKGGTITGKWSSASLPEKEFFLGDIQGKQVFLLSNKKGQASVIIIFLTGIILVACMYRLIKGQKNQKHEL